MLTLFFSILTILTFITLVTRQKNTAIVLSGLSLLVFYAATSGFLSKALLDQLQVLPRLEKTQWKQSNAVILLGTGAVPWKPSELITPQNVAYSRLNEAYRQYRLCKQANVVCKIIATGGDPGANGVSEAEVMGNALTDIGLNADDLILETRSYDTEDNARFSSEVIAEQNFEQVVLVSSGIHLPRAELWFNHYGVQGLLAPADHLKAGLSLIPNARNFYFSDLAVHEFGGILEYYMKRSLNMIHPRSVP